jgi:uncharacterized protein (DUF2384 family)
VTEHRNGGPGRIRDIGARSGGRPIDLLSTPAGVELVETLLERIEYGVYT